jgi:cobalt-zinc-cadmium efflux system membrane fusion protein
MNPVNFGRSLFALILATAACGQGAPPGSPAPEGAGAPEAAAGGHGDGHGHGEAAAKVSDLDQPIDALLAKRCEHGRKTYQCDECRYEVGVARVPRSLRDDGLLKTAVATRRKLEAPLDLTGEIRFDERHVTHVAPSTEARVRSVRVSLGDRVAAGAPLVVLESVALGDAQGQYLEAKGALELARKAAERAEGLRQEQIASEKEWLQARQERDAAEIRARAAGERLLRLGLSPADLEAVSGRAGGAAGTVVLRAPAAGVVLEMHAVPGELVKPDQSILTVGDLSDLWIWADLYEDQLGRVLAHQGKGLRASVSVKAFPGEAFPGTVDFVAPTMDEKTRTVKARIGVRNPGGRLRAGMFADVRLYLPGDVEGLAVPRASVLSDEGRSFVFVQVEEEYFLRRPVETGRAGLDWVEITRGLEAGKTVAADGAFLLKSDVLRSKMGAGCAD